MEAGRGIHIAAAMEVEDLVTHRAALSRAHADDPLVADLANLDRALPIQTAGWIARPCAAALTQGPSQCRLILWQSSREMTLIRD
jgi:hypothetical protein